MRAQFDSIHSSGLPFGQGNATASRPPQWRTLFISDVHLGSPGCQAEALLAFLKAHTCQRLYLVGDIVDGWQL
ncbi:MAG: UDP-2,3-diacylglucosamine diphosphatase, partial [Rhodoferax sp.]|nr:UDP-2,3-diacylglucosamine diphosphatase [Rhodoferax sp.]